MANLRFRIKLLSSFQNNYRQLSTSAVCCSRINFRKFQLFHFRWDRRLKERQKTNPHPDIPIYNYGVREPGFKIDQKFHEVPEMIPEFIVPDLTNFKLKPYVSYRVPVLEEPPFTAKDLFEVVYGPKIVTDFSEGKLDEDGNPLNPSENENLTPEEARNRALKTGSDIF